MKRPRIREHRSYPGDGTVPFFSEGKTEHEYQINWWLTFAQALKAGGKRPNWSHEDFVLHWIGQHKKVFPFLADITRATQKNDIRFFIALGTVLKNGRREDFGINEHTLIRLWNNPVAPGLPKLNCFTESVGKDVLAAARLGQGKTPLNAGFGLRDYRNTYHRVLGLRLAPGSHQRELTSDDERRITLSERRFRDAPDRLLFGGEPPTTVLYDNAE